MLPVPPTPVFTVVIPTYNRPQFLLEAIRSVREQTCQDWECIVVDDCGTEPVSDFEDDHRIRTHRQPVNGGAAAAINAGAELARGHHLTFLADDDLWTPRRLEIAEAGLRRAPLAICHSRYLDESGEGNGRCLHGDVSDTILDSMIPSLGAVAIERERWLALREDYRTCEDVEWWLRTAQRTEVETVSELGLLVRRHSGLRHLSGAEERMHDNTRLIADNRVWFDAHPKAEAFRLRRHAFYASLLDNRGDSVRALARSLRLNRSPGTLKQLLLAAAGRPRPRV